MKAVFDYVAQDYDQDFTYSLVGQAQRRMVWTHLAKILAQNKILNILELNCGTGEDAIGFAELGYQVLASDISDSMLDIVWKKAQENNLTSQIRIKKLDMNMLKAELFTEKFDLVFSNFGGLNCISSVSLSDLAANLSQVLHPDGKFIGVIMSPYCLWETAYFLLKGKFKSAFRRFTHKSVQAQVGRDNLSIWYYSPQQFDKIFRENFRLSHQQAIGLFLPPSYLNHFFKNRKKWLNYLENWEIRWNQKAFLAKFADHFLIEFTKKD